MKKVIRFTTSKVDMNGITFFYKKAEFNISFLKLTDHNKKKIIDHLDDGAIVWDCVITTNKRGMMDPLTLYMEKSTENHLPIRLKDHHFIPVKKIPYQLGEYRKVMVQRDGFVVYTAPSGQGKTYFAIHNITMLSNNFDNILYINLELNENDIYNRFLNYNIMIPDNLWIKPWSQVDLIREWSKNKGSCAFIIDNIDNLVGAGLDPFGLQLEFVKELDNFCKFENHHALVLTQLIKDSTNALIDKNGDIHYNITYNNLSGVKQLTHQSRTVMMSAYSEIKQSYVYKILKLGSGEEV